MRARDFVVIGAVSLLAACSPQPDRRSPAEKSSAPAAKATRAVPAAPAAEEPRRLADPKALLFYTADGPTCAAYAPKGGPEFGAEAEAIKATGAAERSGGTLKVAGMTLEDKPFEKYEAEGVEHSYLGRLPNSPIQVVEATYYEWRNWILIDSSNGAHVVMSAPPAPAPGGETFAGLAADISGESFNGVEIVDYRNGEFLSQEFEGGFPCDLRWLSRDELEVKLLPESLVIGSEDPPPSAWKPVRIVRDGGHWRMLAPTA